MSQESFSAVHKKRLEVQGFRGYSDEALACHQFGIRFAYGACAGLVALGLLLESIPVLLFALLVALLGAVLKRHPFDYIYNATLRKWLKRPTLPYRTKQVRFACMIATVWLACTIYFFYAGFPVAGYVWGGILVVLATLVTATDICIPSMIYNAFFERDRDTRSTLQ